jgi:hemolysin III
MTTSHSNETVSSLTHFIATLLSIAGLAVLVTLAALKGTAAHVIGFSIFGGALVLLYLASTVYHFLSRSHPAKDVFQIIDHSMIYLLIAGTYTPLTLIVLPAAWGWSMFGVIWGLALLGILVKAMKFRLHNAVSTSFYLLMGWLIVIAIKPLQDSVPAGGVFWLVAGGIFYTIGTIFYGLTEPPFPTRWYTYHDVFHVFVMLGSFSHFWFMFTYVLP